MMYMIFLAFPTSNNKAKYKALIDGLRVASDMRASKIRANVNSKLVANQINESFKAGEKRMTKYLKKVRELVNGFQGYEFR